MRPVSEGCRRRSVNGLGSSSWRTRAPQGESPSIAGSRDPAILHPIMKTVTIVSTWEAEDEVELTDEEYADLVATSHVPELVFMELDTQGACLMDWGLKQDNLREANARLAAVVRKGAATVIEKPKPPPNLEVRDGSGKATKKED